MPLYPKNSVIMAPLAGYTDLPYRRSLRRHGCYYAFTEMVDTGSLIYSKKVTRNFLDRGDDEPWLGVQVVGAKIDEIEKAVDIINQREFSVLDLNLGCPTPKVVRKGKGAGLGKNPDLAAKIIELMVKKSRFPVTAKIRIQDISDPESTIYLAKKLEDAGIRAMTIHGRLLKAIYSGPCYADIIAAVRASVNVQVIANGGVTDRESYLKLKEASGASEIMIARGAMGNPWIFEEVSGKRTKFPSTEELCEEMERHVLETVEYYGEALAMKLTRKHILDYLGGRGYTGKLKCSVSGLSTLKDFKLFMEEVRKGPTERYKTWAKKFI